MSSLRVVPLSELQQFTAINLTLDQGHVRGKFIVPNGIRVIINWGLGDGKLGHCVLGGQVASGFSPTPVVAEAIRVALVGGANWTALAAQLGTTFSLSGVMLRDLRVLDQPLVSSTGSATPGTAATAEMPNEIAAVVTLRTALVGRANRGRMFVPGWAAVANSTLNIMTTAASTALQTWASAIPGILLGQGITMAIIHPPRAAYTSIKTGTVFPARDPGLVPITQLVVRDNHWDSQRRRGLK